MRHKNKMADQASACAQREDKRMEVSEKERTWWVGLQTLRSSVKYTGEVELRQL